jgi:hypothetical protein
MGIDKIQDLAAFIEQPSQMYQNIMATVLEIEPVFPTTPYKLPGGVYLADSDTILEMELAFK